MTCVCLLYTSNTVLWFNTAPRVWWHRVWTSFNSDVACNVYRYLTSGTGLLLLDTVVKAYTPSWASTWNACYFEFTSAQHTTVCNRVLPADDFIYVVFNTWSTLHESTLQETPFRVKTYPYGHYQNKITNIIHAVFCFHRLLYAYRHWCRT